MYSPSSTDYKPFQYFAQTAPEAFNGPQLFATNPSGDTVYAARITISDDVDERTGELQSNREAIISQYKMTSGESITYDIDTSISNEDLRRHNDFYVLSDYIAVFVTYEPGACFLTQFLLVLDQNARKARMVHRKTSNTPAISGNATIGYGKLNNGQILVTGSQGPFDGDKNVVGYLVPANPLNKEVPVNLTKHIATFEKFLSDLFPSHRIFDNGVFIDESALYFLISSGEKITEQIGKYIFNPKKDENRCSLVFNDYFVKHNLRMSHFNNSSQRGRNLWLFFSQTDYAMLTSWRWQIYLRVVPFFLKVLGHILSFTLWMRRFDNGLFLRGYVRILHWMFGPTLLPPLQIPLVSVFCSVDLKQLMVREVKCKIATKFKGHIPYFDAGFDCDQDGGLVVAQFLEDEQKKISVRHFSSMSQPPSLAKISQHNVYRWYPAFEKSSTMRRVLGVVDY